jgi:hypothetical protein
LGTTSDVANSIVLDALVPASSATATLLFQIPYISVPPDPREDRGYIDLMIRELTAKPIGANPESL